MSHVSQESSCRDHEHHHLYSWTRKHIQRSYSLLSTDRVYPCQKVPTNHEEPWHHVYLKSPTTTHLISNMLLFAPNPYLLVVLVEKRKHATTYTSPMASCSVEKVTKMSWASSWFHLWCRSSGYSVKMITLRFCFCFRPASNEHRKQHEHQISRS